VGVDLELGVGREKVDQGGEFRDTHHRAVCKVRQPARMMWQQNCERDKTSKGMGGERHIENV
jgi:hypothetical protein